MIWLLVVVVAFQLAGAAFTSRPGVVGSRRLLAGVVALLVPLVGPLLGAFVRDGRGQGKVPLAGRRLARRARISATSVNRLNRLPPILDRLMSTDAPERLAALVQLSTFDDAAAITLLRWTLDHGTTEVALDAALALEELDVRLEAHREATRQALDEVPSFERALAAAEAAAAAVLNRLGDGPGLATMAARARAAYQVAVALAPERWAEIEERLAHLELASGCPEVALDHLSRLASAPGADPTRLAELEGRAVFAARRFPGAQASDG